MSGHITFANNTERTHNEDTDAPWIPFITTPHCHPARQLREPVTSLEQLYIQSVLFLPIWRAKNQQWALDCGALFPVKEAYRSELGTLIRWDTAHKDERLRQKVQFAETKPIGRAMQKLAHRA